MKYLIVKGWLGFGDRLEHLKMCVLYAQTYNLQIYVDWRDSMWSHGNEDFYTYFKLINMPVLNSLADIPADATYYPAYWKGNLDEKISWEFIGKRKEDNIDIGQLLKPYDADVIVASNIGFRTIYPDQVFFTNVFRVIDTRVLAGIQYHRSKHPVEKSWGVHIRGTDHLRDRHRHMSVQSMVSHVTIYGGMNVQNILSVSDDKENLEIWRRFYPKTYVVSNPLTSSLAGNHNLDSKTLETSKDELNVSMLIDFFIFALCERRFSTIKSSRFSREANRLHPYIDTLLSAT